MTERRAIGFEPWLNRNHVVSRLVLLGAMVQLIWVTLWSMNYAYFITNGGAGVAAVIAAVQAPVALFAGWVFKAYLDIMRTEQMAEERRTTVYKHEESTSTSVPTSTLIKDETK